jgi:hypothetical protein
MKWCRPAVVALLMLFQIAPACAEDHPTFKGLWTAATAQPGSKTQEYPDFLMVTSADGLTMTYFTKPNHPAYPGVITRTMTEEDGAMYVEEHGQSFASDAAQPAFKAWLAQFQELDRQMKDYVASHH